MNDPDLSCKDERRREDVRTASLFGLDYLEVSDSQTTLYVYFLGKAPEKVEKANVRIEGGRRIRGIQVTDLRVHRQPDPALDDSLEVTVNKPGDFSTYTLSLVKLDERGHPTDQPMDGFDPRYGEVHFTFKAGCPSDLDCKPRDICPPPERIEPEINYLAKDYSSFRQLILDRLALIMPGWQETHVPDLGITVVELLAYVGDYLSYYQDAVATEAYLGTARQRISVHRHARLVDYPMHEGCNARAWVTINTDTDHQFDNPEEMYFITGYGSAPADRHVLGPEDLVNVPAHSYEVFEPLRPGAGDHSPTISIYKEHSEMHFYTWGDCECCLAAGVTSATLIDQWLPAPEAQPGTAPEAYPTYLGRATAVGISALLSDGPPGTMRALHLQVGDVLLFEEVIGPKTGNPADADPRHRQAVRLTRVTPAVDPLYHPDRYGPDFGQPIVEIEWASEDALTFPLCVSALAPPPDCTCMENVSVARGNVILVDNGASTGGFLGTVPTESTTERCPTECDPGDTAIVPGQFRPTLHKRPLTFSQPLPPCGSASTLVVQDPRRALPWVSLASIPPEPGGGSWSVKRDLLESGSNDPHFVVEMDNDGYAHLRFGDGDVGLLPGAGTAFQASYRVGNGPSGNVGAETISYLVLRQTTLSGVKLTPRNPLPAMGGTTPEPLAEVKLFAPSAFRKVLERAITADDYATLAGDNARRQAARSAFHMGSDGNACLASFRKVQRAAATLSWTGSWYEILVAIDPIGTEEADPALLTEISAYLEPYRRIGHNLVVAPAQYVPLDVAMTVCVLPHYLRGHVEAALLDVFGNRALPDGRLGFFHPDNLTFGEGIYASRLVAAAQAVTGVQSVTVTRVERFEIGEPPVGVEAPEEEVPPDGVLRLGPLEVAQLDNDPSFPENGRLVLDVRGGR